MSARLLDPDFKYTPAAETDIRKTFARVRRELKAAELAKVGAVADAAHEFEVATGCKVAATVEIDGHVITLPAGRKKA